VPTKNANSKAWFLKASVDGRRYSNYPIGNKTPSALLTLPYSTTFTSTENPVSQGGIWLNGLTNGLQWNDMQTNGAGVFGVSASPSFYDDNVACINPTVFSFGARQYIKGVIKRAGGYAPTMTHEIELHLRCTIGPNSVSTMELLMDSANSSTMNRWNGDLNDVTILGPTGAGIGALVDGDEVLFRVDENGVFEAFKNGSGTAALTITDTTPVLATGTPGVAAFWRPDASVVPTSFGFKSIEVGNW
jgi:hypothetical protein